MKTNPLFFLFILLLATACQEERLSFPQVVEVPAEELVESVVFDSTAPLAGMLRLETKEAALVEIEIQGPRPANIGSGNIDTRHEIPLTGLYPGQNNWVKYKVLGQSLHQYAVDSFSIEAPPLPGFMPEVRIEQADPSRMEAGWTLIEFNLARGNRYQTIPLAFDRNGDIRWFLNLGWTGGWTAPFEPLQNGAFRFGHSHRIYMYDKLGRRLNNWYLDGHQQHHDVYEKPNGNFLVPTSKLGLNTALDFIVEVDRQSGEIIREWDLRQVLDVDRFELIRSPRDWLHVNSVWYDERDSSLIISAKHQGVFKVSSNNELRWILAPHRGWGQAGLYGNGLSTADRLLTAVDQQGQPFSPAVQEGEKGLPEFRWSWGQHAAMVLPDGKLLLFDNGLHRNFLLDDSGFSRAVVYDIDEEKLTVRQAWQYGALRGEDLYSSIISDADFLPETGNVLLTSGYIKKESQRAKVIEVAYPSQEVVFEATILFKSLYGDGRGWRNSDMAYRGERLQLWNQQAQ